MSITLEQCRAARGLLGWSQARLCEAAKVSPATVANFEAGKRIPIANNLTAIRTALESAGVIFIDQNGDGPGVRLRKAD
ncbi:XRE family transcriptional regulator [Aquamicrobium defluvii]|uniref:XRE family transcriptional regulator n=2 Tax=Aquamicrobium defluvii TaxID=69279 RepID=A0A011UVY0_9HYPH|nr:helix-turn-helix transcriptional regulator [Aquamicrobium defluvii]EXL10008.1 XRE family transcriptional regulator [Aquamicrobium defluvii]EZQ16751.1 XRE family transcriptional regulator [Halopseudomonas bauzanensis]